MRSLRDSSSAMKRAGLGVGVEEAETVMSELDDQIREASELTSVLATPIVPEDEEEIDLDAELGLLEREAVAEPAAEPPRPAPAPPQRAPPAPAPPQRAPLMGAYA